MAWLEALRARRHLVAGLVAAPLGLYAGLRLADREAERKIAGVRREVAAPPPAEPLGANRVRTELDSLREARAALRRQESLLAQEIDSIDAKLRRLDEQEQGQGQDQDQER
ncbi:hypothetical protein H4R18_005807 [Coemansia javaensis]|uniref:Uncharacterized protein n=1 Tax=Coemansia javaensis TaxID=2761396 RepID=A0A9W8LES5_9FUNG|nr:hypothetical protein H4R18_005807 [Coemansia javaensis]